MKNVFILAIAISTTLIALVILQHNLSFKGTIVLPAGGTYLGPSSTPSTPNLQGETLEPRIVEGTLYPYTFMAPEGVKLVSLGGEFDIYALDFNGQPPEQNVLIGVDTVEGNKKSYVENWWKQFGGLKGVNTIRQFKNSKGLTGYTVKYIGGSDTDIFFESPDGNYMIHLANGPLEKKIFDAIVDSVAWKK